MEFIVLIYVRKIAILMCVFMSVDHVLVNLDGKGPTVAKIFSITTDNSCIKSINSSSLYQEGMGHHHYVTYFFSELVLSRIVFICSTLDNFPLS